MLKSYLTVALRSLRRHPGYAAINVFGLSVGLACCLLIFLYVRNELAVNTAFDEVERIYRIDSEWREASMGIPVTTLAPVGETLVREYPEIVDQVRLYLMSNTIRVGDDSYRKDVMMADTSVFRLTGMPLLFGDPDEVLRKPRSVVITEQLAEDLFGVADARGRTILFETWSRGEQVYTVTGIRKTLPYNSITYFNADKVNYDLIITPYPYGDFFQEAGWTGWNSRFILQFVKLAPGVAVEAVQAKLDGFIETYAPEDFHGNLSIHLNPLRALYLSDNNGLGWRVVKILAAVAALLLLIAAINFMNLSTARSLSRAREIGMRKTLGANKAQLLSQFLGESVLICTLAALFGVLIAWSWQDLLFQFAGKNQVLAQPWDGVTLAVVLGVTLVTGVGAGLYPAFVLAAFRPVKALKGSLRLSTTALRLRQGLVVAQFGVAIVLLVGVVTIVRQLSFIMQKDLGFDKENVLVINSVPRQFDAAGLDRMKTVKQRLERVPGVVSASLSWRTAAEGGDSRAFLEPGSSPETALSAPAAIVDDAFLQAFGLTLREGRFFSSERPANSAGIVLNESAVRAFGWQDGIEGKHLVIWNTARPSLDTDPPPARPVLGVVADYHFESLHQPIRPLALLSVETEQIYRVLSLRLSTTDLQETMARVKTAWRDVLPASPFEYIFLDDQVDLAYRTEQQVRGIVGLAAALAILIACLGMLGLASISVIQRTKEVGIRKVLGATVANIVLLLSRDFARPVVVAIVIALPLAYFALNRWLDDFAYHIEISWPIFLMAGLAALLIALLTVSFHAISAATADPVETLRYE